LLLVTAFGAGSNVNTPGKRVFSHHFTFGADLVLFGYLIWQVGQTTARASRSWIPCVLIVLGCLLVLLDTSRHVLLDHGGVFFEPQLLVMFTPTGDLSPIGRTCQWTTIIGLVLLFVGLASFFQLPAKIYACFQ